MKLVFKYSCCMNLSVHRYLKYMCRESVLLRPFLRIRAKKANTGLRSTIASH